MQIYLQIVDSIIEFQAYMIEKFRSLVSIYYQFQSNSVTLLYCLSDKHMFLNLDFDKI